MVSKNNRIKRMEEAAERQSHFGIRKLTVGAASVLLGITLLFGANAKVARADETNAQTGTSAVETNAQTGTSAVETKVTTGASAVETKVTTGASAAETKVTTGASAAESDNNKGKKTNQSSTDVHVLDSNESTTINNGENEAKDVTQKTTSMVAVKTRQSNKQALDIAKTTGASAQPNVNTSATQGADTKQGENPDWYMTDPSKATDENAARKNLEQAIAYAKANPIKGLDIKGEQDAEGRIIVANSEDAKDAITIAYDNEKDSAQYMQSTANKIWDEIKTYEAYEAERETFMDGLAAEGLYNPKTDVDPTTLSQHLTLDSEPDAIVNLEIKNKSGNWITATENGLENGLEKDKLVTGETDLLTIANGADKSDLDAMGSKRGWTVTFNGHDAVKDFIRLTFTNLKNSHYDDGTNAVPINKIVETFSDVHTTYGEPAKFIFANDPTRGWWYNHCSGVTATIKLYGEYDKTDENGRVIKDKDGKVVKEEKLITFNQPVYMSVSSLNTGKGSPHKESAQLESDSPYKESAQLESDGEAYKIPESSVIADNTSDNKKLYSPYYNNWYLDGEKDTDYYNYWGKVFEPAAWHGAADEDAKVNELGKHIVETYKGWDNPDQYNRIFGSGLYKVNGDHITVRSYVGGSQENQSISQYNHVWFAYSTILPETTFDAKHPGTTINYHFAKAINVKTSQTVKFVDDQGHQLITPNDIQSGYRFQIEDGKPTEESHTYNNVAVPVIEGYVADKTSLIKDKDGGTYVPGQKVTVDNPNVTIEVVYHKVGKIVPVGKDGKEIPGASTPYKNDPTDPTKVTPDESTPSIPGYHITDNENPGKNPDGTPNNNTVTPQKPTMDTKVVYTKQGSITVKYHDTTDNVDIPGYGITDQGNENDPFSYNPNSDLGKLEDKGYVKDGDLPTIPTHYMDKAQTFVINVKHGTRPVDPKHPVDIPGLTHDDLEKKVTRDFTYNFTDGSNHPEAKEDSQTVTFEGHATIDKVTGQLVTVDEQGNITGVGQVQWDKDSKELPKVVAKTVNGYHVVSASNANADGSVDALEVNPNSGSIHVVINYAPNNETVFGKQIVHYIDGDVHYVDGDNNKLMDDSTNSTCVFTKDDKTGKWKEDSYTFSDATAPVIYGYVAEQKTYKGQVATPTDPNKEITIVYHKVGKIVPVGKDGKEIPGAPTPEYKNDPTDPTNVKPDEPIPNVPGYTPVDPSPITPQKPTMDTKVVYIKNPDKPTPTPDEETVTVKYYDDDQNDPQDLSSYNKEITGEAGSDLGYSTKPSIDELQNKGYKLVSDSFAAAKLDGKMPAKGGNYEVHFVHDQIPVGPDKPGKPDNPINPNDPDGPKYPKDSDKVSVEVTRTIHYKGLPAGNTPDDVTQPAYFTAEGVLDKATGEWSTPLKWSADQTIVNVVSPKVEGYHVAKVSADSTDGTNVDAKTLSHTDKSYIVTVTYVKDKVVPPVVNTVTVKYYDDDQNDPQDLSSYNKEITGEAGSDLGYSTKPSIDELQNKGYKLVSDSFAAAKLDGKMPAKGGNYEVHFVHDQIPVGPDKPGKPDNPINPNDPDGPKWPKGSYKDDLTKDSTQTITYHYSDGSQPDSTKTETNNDTFTKTVTVDKVTGKIVSETPWTGSHTFDSSNVPVVNGYHSDKRTVGGKTATVNNPDVTDTVTYTPNGKIIPVDPSGNPIPNVPTPTYPTDPNDPTKVVPNEPVPNVPGMTPETPTVTPADPTKDTPVVYNPIPNVPGPSVGPSDNTPTPVTPTPGKTTEEKKPDENKDDKDVDEPDDDEDVVPTPRHHKKHNGGESSTTRPRPTGYTPAPRGSSYLDANGKVHYKLPQTGESDSEEMAAVLGGAAATIGLIGLAGAKKRRHE